MEEAIDVEEVADQLTLQDFKGIDASAVTRLTDKIISDYSAVIQQISSLRNKDCRIKRE